MSSAKYNPFKNSIRKYFRYITNLGFPQLLVIGFLIFIVAIYPLWESSNFVMSKELGFSSSIIVFLYSVIVLIMIIPQFFTFTEKEYQSAGKTENTKSDETIEIDYSIELQALHDYLIKSGHDELLDFKKIGNATINNNLRIGKFPEAFFVINIKSISGSVYEIRKVVEDYAFDFCKDLYNYKIDINSFVLSFFIQIDKDLKKRNIFLRIRRTELDNLLNTLQTSDSFVKSIENKLIDELFRDL